MMGKGLAWQEARTPGPLCEAAMRCGRPAPRTGMLGPWAGHPTASAAEHRAGLGPLPTDAFLTFGPEQVASEALGMPEGLDLRL